MTLPFPKTALVTGGAKRLGLIMATRLAAEGWQVVIHANTSGAQGQAALTALGDKAHLVTGDFMVEADMAATYDQAVEKVGPLGVLINNASTFEYDDVARATQASWDTHMLVNARAPFVLSQRVAAGCEAAGHGACIINMLDQRIFNWNHHFATYSIAKGALWTMTQTMAISLAPLKIRVNGIGPGPTLPSPRQDWDSFKVQQRYTLLDRLVDPQEIADTAHYLIHNQSVTGQMIAVDGGQHLNWAPPKSKDLELGE